MFGPMTIIVMLVLGVVMAAGLAVIARAFRTPQDVRRGRVCSRCRTSNPKRAKYCALCGESLA